MVTKKYTSAALTDFLNDVRPFTVGFDHVFSNLGEVGQTSSGYPPYNIVKESEENYTIEVAAAGFSKSDFDIELVPEGRKLVVKGEPQEKEPKEYLHKGIGERKFTRVFALSDDVEVVSSQFSNGVLYINLKKVVPEEKKPVKIEVE